MRRVAWRGVLRDPLSLQVQPQTGSSQLPQQSSDLHQSSIFPRTSPSTIPPSTEPPAHLPYDPQTAPRMPPYPFAMPLSSPGPSMDPLRQLPPPPKVPTLHSIGHSIRHRDVWCIAQYRWHDCTILYGTDGNQYSISGVRCCMALYMTVQLCGTVHAMPCHAMPCWRGRPSCGTPPHMCGWAPCSSGAPFVNCWAARIALLQDGRPTTGGCLLQGFASLAELHEATHGLREGVLGGRNGRWGCRATRGHMGLRGNTWPAHADTAAHAHCSGAIGLHRSIVLHECTGL